MTANVEKFLRDIGAWLAENPLGADVSDSVEDCEGAAREVETLRRELAGARGLLLEARHMLILSVEYDELFDRIDAFLAGDQSGD